MVMPAIAPSIVAGGLNFAGQAYANTSNFKMMRRQERFQRQSAQEQMAFQERMSNTSYQRAVLDMRKAGINPILAYTQGGASSPSGASSSGASYASQSPTTAALSSALDARRTFAEVRNLEEVNKNLRETTKEIRARAALTRASAKSIELELPGKKLEADIDSALEGVPSYGLRWWKRMAETFNPSLFRR